MLCRRYITMLDISSMQMTEMHALWLICDKHKGLHLLLLPSRCRPNSYPVRNSYE